MSDLNTSYAGIDVDDIVLAPGQGLLCVMDQTGDTKVIWSVDRPDEVEAAKAQFDMLKKKGYLAYKVKGDGSQGEVMKEFDANAGKLILVPPMRGG